MPTSQENYARHCNGGLINLPGLCPGQFFFFCLLRRSQELNELPHESYMTNLSLFLLELVSISSKVPSLLFDHYFLRGNQLANGWLVRFIIMVKFTHSGSCLTYIGRLLWCCSIVHISQTPRSLKIFASNLTKDAYSYWFFLYPPSVLTEFFIIHMSLTLIHI